MKRKKPVHDAGFLLTGSFRARLLGWGGAARGLFLES